MVHTLQCMFVAEWKYALRMCTFCNFSNDTMSRDTEAPVWGYNFVDNVPIAAECFSMTYTYKVIMANGEPPGDQQIIQASLHDSLKVDSFILEYALAP